MLGTIKRFPKDAAVLACGVTLLGRLAVHQQNSQSFGVEGCDAVLGALHRFPENEVLCMGGLDALLHLAMGCRANARHLHKLGALEVAATTRERWPSLSRPAAELAAAVGRWAPGEEGPAGGGGQRAAQANATRRNKN